MRSKRNLMESNPAKDTVPIVVVVDDSLAVRVFFEKAVAALAVDLRTFPSAEDAAVFLKAVQPALLFLDIIMPTKDGLTFLQELRRQPLHAQTRTIVISSKDYAQDRATARELGVIEFVPKPMTTRLIVDLIGKHTGAPLRTEQSRA
jgi:chemosensory pili system protein ChpA (sensor histidine kinase/response regulator)